MARIDYDNAAAAAFQASREMPPEALTEWRTAIARHLTPRPGMRVLDLGAGTGDGAWLSTVVHHLPDLPAAARELRRVLRPGAPVLIRGAFPGRHHGLGLLRYWPETAEILDTFPSVASVRAAFASAGFSYVALEPVRQVTAPSLAAIAATTRREAHTPLMLITDSAYQAGLARLRAAAATQQGPVTDTLDLLVLRADRATATTRLPARPGVISPDAGLRGAGHRPVRRRTCLAGRTCRA
jgi:SAM-dependent methyltransferase